jgi:hypothetical protein
MGNATTPTDATAPTDAQRRQLDDHAAAELRFDLDAVMDTVDDEPEYEWQPAGLGLRGRDECRRMYAAFLPRWQELERTADLRFEVRTEFWNEAGRIREQVAFVRNAAGGTDRHDFVVVVLFGRNGVKGERTYASPEFARLTLGDYYDELQPVEHPAG